jgi:ketosteroid isomerase-like protein
MGTKYVKEAEMAEHPNAAKYREVTEAFNAGNIDAMADYVADDIEWWYIGGAEPVRGKKALMDFYAQLSGEVDVKLDLHDVVANDEHLVALVNAHATRGGKTFDYRAAEIHHVKNGKLTHRWAFSDDTEAINKFFA